jgi:excisionase family DNA binding protein
MPTNTPSSTGLADLRGRATCTVEEAGQCLGISRKLAYEAAGRGEIPVLRLGRRLVVPVPKLLAMLEGTQDPAA